MNLGIGCQCPQCGADLPLEEGQRFIVCGFCGAGNFLVNRDLPWLVMPENTGGGPVVFVPYLRCRGTLFTCAGGRIDFRVADTSALAADLPGAALSLGVRPQAVRLRFPGNGFVNRLPVDRGASKRLLAMVNRNRSGKEPEHQALIGEVMSLVWLPLVIAADGVRDASSGARLAVDAERLAAAADRSGPVAWSPCFRAAICPGCGWDLAGDNTSQALLCPNCGAAWSAGGSGFARIEVAVAAGEGDVFLPFWEVGFTLPEEGVESAAGLGRLLALPVHESVPAAGEKEAVPAVLTPAFKIRPKTFLRLAAQMSHARPLVRPAGSLPGRLHPVSLAGAEAVQMVKTVLAARAAVKQEFFRKLPGLRPVVRFLRLVLVPFSDQGYSLFQNGLGISVNRRLLELGRLI